MARPICAKRVPKDGSNAATAPLHSLLHGTSLCPLTTFAPGEDRRRSYSSDGWWSRSMSGRGRSGGGGGGGGSRTAWGHAPGGGRAAAQIAGAGFSLCLAGEARSTAQKYHPAPAYAPLGARPALP